MNNKLLTRDEVLNFDLDNEHWKKIVGETKGGKSVEIVWDRDFLALDDNFSDFGYCFELPEHDQDEGDVFIHIPNPTNVSGMDKIDDVWVHLYDLITNMFVIKVIFKD